MIETLAVIDAPDIGSRKGFCAGIILWNNLVIEAAPIVGYMKRRRYSRDRVREECRRNGWTVKVVHELQRHDL